MRFVLIAVLVAGCVNDPTENSEVVRERYLERHAATFTLPDRGKVVDAIESVLAEEGWALVETEKPNTFRTDMKMEKHSTSECSVHTLMLADGSLWVQVMEIERDDSGEVTAKRRRDDLEWLIAQRADPDRALALMKKANERADKVPAITRKK